MGGTEPGWYPDPEDSARARYWDGSRWTDRTRSLPGAAGPPAPEARLDRPARAAGGRDWWRGRALLIGAVALAALGVGLFVLTSSEDAGAEVILEPTAASGEDPFTDSVAKENVRVKGGGVRQVAGGGGSTESLAGSAPGLYGGTGKQACDAKALVGYLARNPDKAAAFAGVLGITPNAIEDYVAKLTPVLLREDTRVTNHGFRGGRATTLQSVLQAGSAVMVDDRGVPRVRCACGNPLTEPAAVSATPEFRGERWNGFDDGRLVAVSASERPVKSFRLVNVRTGKEYVAAAGGAAMTVERLLNSPIPVAVVGPLPTKPWVDGRHPDSSPTAGIAQVVGIEEGGPGPMAVVGDVTGDGAPDGAVSTEENGGGSGTFFATYVFDATGALLGRLPVEKRPPLDKIGDREFPEDLRIVDGAIEVTVNYHGPTEPLCCPTQKATLRFTWNGTDFDLAE